MKRITTILMAFLILVSIIGCKKARKDKYIVNDPISFDDKIYHVEELSSMLGPDSKNFQMLSEMGAYGSDLGMPVKVKDKILYLFGDTFSGEDRTGMWFSNFGAISSDYDFEDGITFDFALSKNDVVISPLMQGKHHDNNETDKTKEVTKIPTGGIEINGYVYVFYMSVRYWGGDTGWLVTYNQAIKSKSDDLVEWVEVEGLRFDDEEAYNFGQIYPFRDPNSDYIYLFSIPGGRTESCCLSRTKEEYFEDKDRIEYLVDDERWVQGSEGLAMLKENPYYIADGRIGEPCVVYNEYLKKYCMTFSSSRNGKSAVYMLLSDSIDKKFTEEITLFPQDNYWYYGAFTIPDMQDGNGKVMYFVSSRWSTYRTYVTKVIFK